MTKKDIKMFWITYNGNKDTFELWYGLGTCEIIFQEKNDYTRANSFDICAYNISEKHFACAYQCQNCFNQTDNNFIHFSILNEIDKYISNDFVFLGIVRPNQFKEEEE